MKITPVMVRWTVTKAEAQVLTDAAEMMVDAVGSTGRPSTNHPMVAVLRAIRTLARGLGPDETGDVTMGGETANELRDGVDLIRTAMGEPDMGDALTPEQQDALVGLVEALGLNR